MKQGLIASLVVGLMTLNLAGCSKPVSEQGSESGNAETFKGRKVAFVPISMGFDLTQAWSHQMQEGAKKLGYDYYVRDPNWSTDAGAQALTQIIADKPDIIVVQNPDIQSYARLLQQAERQGIYVLQVNMKSSFMTDGYVGSDYTAMGRTAADLAIRQCGSGSGKSGKISIVQGVLTGGASVYQIQGIEEVLKKHPEIKVVSNQAADWDASKAKSITQTVLQQNPDLCAVIGFWDGQDTGIGAAVREANLSDKVFVITSGGGAATACDAINKGTFSAYIKYDAMSQGRDLNAMIKKILETRPEPGASKVLNYTTLDVLAKDKLTPSSCWPMPRTH